jgi:hypothetical protein
MILSVLAPLSSVEVHRRFVGSYRLHLSGRRISRTENHQQAGSACFLHLVGFLHEDGGDTFIRNVGGLLPDYTALQP